MPVTLREFTDVPDPGRRTGTGSGGGSPVPPSVALNLQDAILRHRHFVLMAENQALGQILGPLREARETLTEQLAKFAARDDAIGDLSRLANERRKVLRRRIDEIINIANTDSRKATREALRKFAEREGEIQRNILKREIPDSIQNRVNFDLVGPDIDRLHAMVDQPLGGQRWTVRFEKNAAEMRQALKRQMGTSIALGEGMDEAARRITRSIDSIGMNRATLIARTEIQRVANQTAIATYQANRDVIKELEWIATLDGRTCPICGFKDSETYPVNQPPSDPPPVHPACRCILAPITRSFEELGLDGEDLPPSTRAGMNGQVPATQSYTDWFSRQPADFQREVLGPTRFELYRSGAIDFSSMVKSNRVLPIDELPLNLAAVKQGFSVDISPSAQGIEAAEKVAERVRENLPAPIRKFLDDNDVDFKVMRSSDEIRDIYPHEGQQLNGVYLHKQNNAYVFAEGMNEAEAVHYSLHEIGHAVDRHLAQKHFNISASKLDKFRKAYKADVEGLSGVNRSAVRYFVDQPTAVQNQSEAFANAFAVEFRRDVASHISPNDLPWADKKFSSLFSNSRSLVRELIEDDLF